ncbi:hybrid signal transduction histidine kinase L-like [Bradysia coprophila]|uniref:hybrid signal transduction histidine kinase L-like n=1 Tax=Bradysia coprophila TaxID=38358 RepID=UPI00187DC3BF|nr:hybrid signal transduction histidine kinase L-like [Bradysia coprophila]
MRVNRQVNDEQRTMGSIGYIGGNINYMGGGSMNMEYPFENHPGHYHLWKPPSGYFPRGEAPPPYEEAVALAQAESLNSQCTVSVATTTHRSLPMNLCSTDNSCDGSNITTNTTNLINININNAGNITAVAAGENHQLKNPSYVVRPAVTMGQLESHIVSSSSNKLNVADRVNFNYSTNSLETARSECSYKNCTINKPICCTQSATATPQFEARDVHSFQNRTDPVESNDDHKLSTILPPPLFDESGRSCSTVCTDQLRTPSSRRQHRTIPRHFTTTSEPGNQGTLQKSSKTSNETPKKSSASMNKSKKLICQCPVQHVPMTYMGSKQVDTSREPQNEVFLSTLSTKLNNQKQNYVAKAKSIHATAKDVADCSQSNQNNSSLHRTKSSNKIPTISKQINSNETSYIQDDQQHLHHHHHQQQQLQQQQQQQPPPPQPQQQHQIHSILKNTQTPTPRRQKSPKSNLYHKGSAVSTPFPLQLIDSMAKNTPIENPVLPPKMCKNPVTMPHPSQSPRIQTISRPNDQFMSVAQPKITPRSTAIIGHQQLTHTKSLPRSDDKLTTQSFLYPIGGLSNVEKSRSLGKINYTQSFPMLTNHYTLPKVSTGKVSVISDVVSKVPSVINIPSPINISSKHQVNFNQTSMPNPTAFIPNATTASATTNPLLPSCTSTPKPKIATILTVDKVDDKQLPVCTTYKNCSNPREHFLPNLDSLDDDYLSECENCKSAHGSRYYLNEPVEEQPQETMTLQRKLEDKQEDEQTYYRTSTTLPSNTKQKTATIKNREPWFSTIPASSSSDDDEVAE